MTYFATYNVSKILSVGDTPFTAAQKAVSEGHEVFSVAPIAKTMFEAFREHNGEGFCRPFRIDTSTGVLVAVN